MVFGVQKGGFCIAKVWFLFFECYVVANRLQRISWVNVDISQNVCNLFFICMLHNRHTKVWFLPCKSMVFGVQKGGFYNAKRGFLKEHIGILGV